MTHAFAGARLVMCALMLCLEGRAQALSGAGAGAPPALKVEAGGQPYPRPASVRRPRTCRAASVQFSRIRSARETGVRPDSPALA